MVLLFLSSFMILGGRTGLNFFCGEGRKKKGSARTYRVGVFGARVHVRPWLENAITQSKAKPRSKRCWAGKKQEGGINPFPPLSSSLFCFRFPSLPSHPLLFLCVCTNFNNVGRENRFIRMPPPPECHEQNILVLHVYINKFQNLVNLSSLRPPDSRDPCCAPSYNPFTLFPSVVA